MIAITMSSSIRVKFCRIIQGMLSGKVPLPGARSTPFGVARRPAQARRRLVSMTIYAAHNKRGQRRERRQGAAAGCALYALRGRAASSTGKAKIGLHDHLRGAQQARSAPRTAARCRCRVRTPMPLRGACGVQHRQGEGWSPKPFTRRTTSAVSAANAEELTGAARQVSGEAAPANGSASQVNGSPEASGESRTGDRARRRRAGLEKGPPEPSANDWHPVCGR